jgi:predicted dehydrogenase
MVREVEKAGVHNMVFFNYRRVPAVQFARHLIQDGKLGELHHFRGAYLQDWAADAEFPMVWRFESKYAGSGALGDLGAHVIDLALFLVADITEVVGDVRTFVGKRPLLESADGLTAKAKSGTPRMGTVSVDDSAAFLARFKNGAVGTFETTRFANGRKNANQFEIYGSRGSLDFNLESMNELHYFDKEDKATEQGFKRILVTESEHPYFDAWWPPGHIIGYEHTFIHAIWDFFKTLEENQRASPDFKDGARVQAVLEAVEKSTKSRRWVRID